MLPIQEHIPLAPKTTMKIGGNARFYAELKTKEDVEEATRFAREKNIPLIVLGAGANTIFAEDTIDALIVKIVADEIVFEGNTAKVQTGAYLAQLLNDAAERNLDLSPLTGIPGTVGGALFGNAGQGFGGVWIGHFVESVEVFVDGAWKTFTQDECQFGYRMSIFKNWHTVGARGHAPLRPAPILFSATLSLPTRPKEEINAEIVRLLKRRTETQPHRKTAGSCFLSVNKEEPAWKLIDAAGLRGYRIGGIGVSEKHANFLINEENATFEDAVKLVQHIQETIPKKLSVEMRFIDTDGKTTF